jgi:hypothetical protein
MIQHRAKPLRLHPVPRRAVVPSLTNDITDTPGGQSSDIPQLTSRRSLSAHQKTVSPQPAIRAPAPPMGHPTPHTHFLLSLNPDPSRTSCLSAGA